LPFHINSKLKWENITGKININWKHVFTLTNKTTLDATLRTFQYKILHRVLPGNKLLFIYNIKNEPWCDHCNNVEETLEHLFHLCPIKLELWYRMAEWLSPEIDLYPYINTENIILGIYKEKKDLENSIILLTKRYIYTQKCNNEPINIIGLQNYIRYHAHLEINSICPRRNIRNRQKWDCIILKLHY